MVSILVKSIINIAGIIKLMKTYIFDTNVIIDLLLQEIIKITSQQKEKIELFQRVQPNQRIIAISTLAEFSSVMQKSIPYQFKIHEVKYKNFINHVTSKFIDEADKLSIVFFPERDEFLSAKDLYLKISADSKSPKRIDFADSLLIAIAKKTGAEVVTNDQELQKMLG